MTDKSGAIHSDPPTGASSPAQRRRIESGPFHEVGRLFPDERSVHTVNVGTTVRDALNQMLETRYSQLPVMDKGRVRGVFSLWSLARAVKETSRALNPDQLAVEDMMERLPTVTVEDSLHDVLDLLDRHGALLVGSPVELQAMVTETDVRQYFYNIAKPFALVQEIEISLRAVIEFCTRAHGLTPCINNALQSQYQRTRSDDPPQTLDALTFEDYRSIITNRQNWPLFEGVLGQNRDFVSGRLALVRDIRNAVFHFRGDSTVLDHQTLAGARNWLLDRLESAGILRRDVFHG